MQYVVRLQKIINMCLELSSLSKEEKADLCYELHNHILSSAILSLESNLSSTEQEELTILLSSDISPESMVSKLNALFSKSIASEKLLGTLILEYEKAAKELLSVTYKILPLKAQDEVSHLVESWF